MPFGTWTDPGETTIWTSDAGSTVKVVDPVAPPCAAEMSVVPGVPCEELARPAPLTVAVAGVPDVQLAVLVMSSVAPSENVATALNWMVTPSGMCGLGGVTVMSTMVTLFTCRVVEPLMLFTVAVIVVSPGATAVARPSIMAIVAFPVSDEVQIAPPCVKSTVLPLDRVPMALY